MAKDLNRVTLIGRLGKDPEVRYTPSGHAICTFSMATGERIKRGNEWEEKTTWHNIVAWRELGERAGDNLTKGDLVFVDGKLTVESWEDRDGKTVYATKIVASTILGCEALSKREVGGDSWPVGAGHGSPPEDDDIPF